MTIATPFKAWLDSRNKTKSEKGEIIEDLKGYQYPAFVLIMYLGDYAPPDHLATKKHEKAYVRIKWEAERDGCDIEQEVKALQVDDDADPKWWDEAGAEEAEWDAAAPAEQPAPEKSAGKAKNSDRKELAKALGLTVPNTTVGTGSRYTDAVAFFIGRF